VGARPVARGQDLELAHEAARRQLQAAQEDDGQDEGEHEDGTQTKAAFCSHIGFFTTLRKATSVIAPAGFRLTSSATPWVGVTSVTAPAASFFSSS